MEDRSRTYQLGRGGRGGTRQLDGGTYQLRGGASQPLVPYISKDEASIS